MDKVYNVGIIGGGVSGVVTAIQLADSGIESVLFEQENSVVNGPPFCHLHAGGNLYPGISDQQCRQLMKQSISMAKIFPQSIDERPTFISIPKSEKYEVDKVEKRLKMLVDYYKTLVNDDPSNKILGPPEDYYKIYNKEKLSKLANQPSVKNPKSSDEWMCNAIKLVDYKKLKLPVVLVQEYGWNLFRLGAQAQLALQKTDLCNLQLNTKILDIKDVRKKNLEHNWELHTKKTITKVKFLVNSCGFKTGEIDETLNLKVKRLVEFKAAYVSKWSSSEGLIPELIFHGERGTNHGMAQLTPCYDNYYQIHGMTNNITLFDNGLVQSKDNKAQPRFNETIKKKLNHGWDKDEISNRTQNAIQFVTRFIPTFKTATIGGPPLYGAQQILGNDPNLRVGEVSFPSKSYARSEIIKASSALTVANQIIDKVQEEKIIPTLSKIQNENKILESISKNNIDLLSSKFAIQRGYPEALSRLLIEKD